jgi:acyl-CoA reductase-like NAD-dependent aldehyde dehydrogenase
VFLKLGLGNSNHKPNFVKIFIIFQICIAIKRVYVHSSIYSKFLAAMVETTKALAVGDGFADNVALGPIQNQMQYTRVLKILQQVKNSQLQVAVGSVTAAPDAGKGYFIMPTVVDNPPDASTIVADEPFGK